MIVAESPPESGLYFYDPEGGKGEPLFSALMKQLGASPKDKEEGLRELQRRGWVLVDATYEPVDKFALKKKIETILRDYPYLGDDLTKLLPDPSTTPVILIKAIVCRDKVRDERPRCIGQVARMAQANIGHAIVPVHLARIRAMLLTESDSRDSKLFPEWLSRPETRRKPQKSGRSRSRIGSRKVPRNMDHGAVGPVRIGGGSP